MMGFFKAFGGKCCSTNIFLLGELEYITTKSLYVYTWIFHSGMDDG